jgi:hypothetical protein
VCAHSGRIPGFLIDVGTVSAPVQRSVLVPSQRVRWRPPLFREASRGLDQTKTRTSHGGHGSSSCRFALNGAPDAPVVGHPASEREGTVAVQRGNQLSMIVESLNYGSGTFRATLRDFVYIERMIDRPPEASEHELAPASGRAPGRDVPAWLRLQAASARALAPGSSDAARQTLLEMAIRYEQEAERAERAMGTSQSPS